MLLKELSEEKRIEFLNLVKAVMSADGSITEMERELYDELCGEIDITNEMYYEKETTESLKIICDKCSQSEKRLIMFELISMACVDKDVDESENVILKNIKETFDISDDDYEIMIELTEELIDLQQTIKAIINKRGR